MPTPTPPIQRKKISEPVDHASPQPTEQASRKNEATISTFLRPKRSLTVPGAKAAEHRPDHRRTDEPAFHQRREAEVLHDQILGARDDKQVVAEQQSAQGGGETAK